VSTLGVTFRPHSDPLPDGGEGGQMGSKQTEALPPLYEPQLIALGTNAMLLRGFESNAGAGYVQEWRCEIE
jgi:hypothetical protein